MKGQDKFKLAYDIIMSAYVRTVLVWNKSRAAISMAQSLFEQLYCHNFC